jgi:hypothetical protein
MGELSLLKIPKNPRGSIRAVINPNESRKPRLKNPSPLTPSGPRLADEAVGAAGGGVPGGSGEADRLPLDRQLGGRSAGAGAPGVGTTQGDGGPAPDKREPPAAGLGGQTLGSRPGTRVRGSRSTEEEEPRERLRGHRMGEARAHDAPGVFPRAYLGPTAPAIIP